MKNELRDTKQRAAIRRAIDNAGRPLSVTEILAEASKDVPNLGIATVYRNLKGMTARGEVSPIHGVGIPPCYASPKVADLCADTDRRPLYQVGTSLYLEEPEGFLLDCPYRILTGHIE